MAQVDIRLEGHLDQGWADWLDGFALSHTEGGETILSGQVRDQAALFGLIAKLRDLGVRLVSVSYQREGTPERPDQLPGTSSR
jgi:hypothetical protein